MSEFEVQSMYEKDEVTIQGALESAVWNILKPSNPVKFVTSSRTDTGVHALLNTAHVDLCPSPISGRYVSPRDITKMVNLWMIKKDLDIRVRKTMAVPPTFHCRYDVACRTYLYRIAVVPEGLQTGSNTWETPPFASNYKRSRAREYNRCILSKLSILEGGRYGELQIKDGENFEVELFKQALMLMLGEHNFSNFSKTRGHFIYRTVDGKKYTKIPRTVLEMTKEVTKIEVVSQPPPFPVSLYPAYGDSGVQFLDVVIEGKSFLHNQVRRMVGAAMSVACGRVSLEKIADLLEQPDLGWDSDIKIFVAASDGLYLANIAYKKGALDQATECNQEILNLEKIKIIPSEDLSEAETILVTDI